MKLPKSLFRGFRRPREVIFDSLGKLEREVLNEIWRRAEISVRDIYETFEERIAYTTLMTTLDRLHKKGFLERRKMGRAFLYKARFSQEELERNITEDVIGGLLNGGAEQVEPVLSCIVDTVSDCDRDLLDELERLVQEKRRELGKND